MPKKQQSHPHIYLRQVSLPGIDSKFVEQHRSVLSALMAHKPFRDREIRPERRKLQHLTLDEQTLYQDLGSNKYQPNVRLEQERVPFDYVRATLAGITDN